MQKYKNRFAFESNYQNECDPRFTIYDFKFANGDHVNLKSLNIQFIRLNVNQNIGNFRKF